MEVSQTSKHKTSIDIFKLIQPELLSVEELVDILQERGVGTDLLCHSKDKLVSLFKRVALPLPQREFRQNYRGSLLMKLRIKAERLKISMSAVSESNSYTIGVTGDTTLALSSHKDKRCIDRLKPPPDLINYERKKIRLNSTSNSMEPLKHNCTSDLDTIVIKKRKPSESSSDSVTEKNSIITSNTSLKECNEAKTNILTVSTLRNSFENNLDTGSSSKGECNGTKINSTPKKISLKRNHLTSKAPGDSSSSPISEPDKKRRPITWP